ncbi:MAG TPA: tetratricopeptide repeat protein [Burkholderiales bacterium]|nr:tetratricopeptide repeat protein [Burkholderiales bacterium]
MPILGAICGAIQFCFAYHALKTGRPYYWVFIIIAFPIAGCVLYYFIEVFPTSRENRRAEKALRSLAKSFDPQKELRERAADVEACGSIANRVALARECIANAMYGEAAALYRSCLSGLHQNDSHLRFGLAQTLVLVGEFDEAEEIARSLRETEQTFRPGEVQMVLAQALEGLHRFDEALVEFKLLAESYPGEEGRWRYGALLKRLGRSEEAREVFQRMLRNAERMSRHHRDAQNKWLSLAKENL